MYVKIQNVGEGVLDFAKEGESIDYMPVIDTRGSNTTLATEIWIDDTNKFINALESRVLDFKDRFEDVIRINNAGDVEVLSLVHTKSNDKKEYVISYTIKKKSIPNLIKLIKRQLVDLTLAGE